jgi:hypothetical protein
VAVKVARKLLIIKRLVTENVPAWVGNPETIRRNALKTGRLRGASGRLIIQYLFGTFFGRAMIL